MADLKTTYMGVKLKNPIIAGSSNLTGSIDKIKELEDNDISAIVLKSIFEEQISMEIGSIGQDAMAHTEGYDYISQYTKQFNLENYLNLIRDSKEKTNIPVIASINCISDGEWVSFAEKITKDCNLEHIIVSVKQYYGQDFDEIVKRSTKLPCL